MRFRLHVSLILDERGRYLGYLPPLLIERMAEGAQKIHQGQLIFQEMLATATK
jgi:hypothetical protein